MPLAAPIVFALMVLVALGVLGVIGVIEVPRRLIRMVRRDRPALPSPDRPAPPPPPPRDRAAPPAKKPAKEKPDPDADLLRYPRQLEGLEEQLGVSLDALLAQLGHLRERHAELSAKAGRDDLAARYAEDLALLERREAGMRRVLGLVWKARALLTLRAHLAASARRRPELPALPPVDDPSTDLEAAAALYSRASASVREFYRYLQARMQDLARNVPSAPERAELSGPVREEVEREELRVHALYVEQADALDKLADTLSYLADRSRTRRVVQGSAPALADASTSESLLNEVERALGQLQDLADAGDRTLADLAVQNLAEDITQLERAGLEAQAEADAALEVARLLEQF